MRTKHSTLLALVALMAGSATSANAAIIFYLDVDIPIPVDYSGVSLDLEEDPTLPGNEPSNDLAGTPGGDVNFVFGGEGFSNDADQTAATPSWQPVRTNTGNSDPLQALGVGTVVNASSTYSTGFGGSVDNFAGAGTVAVGTREYIGFSVILDDGNDTVAYGWMEVTLQNDGVTPGVIHSWAFENTGAAIAVAAVPEPTQSLLVALGLSLSLLRRRR